MLKNLPRCCAFVLLVCVLIGSRSALAQQRIEPRDKGRVDQMLRDAYNEVKKNYYEYTFTAWTGKRATGNIRKK